LSTIEWLCYHEDRDVTPGDLQHNHLIIMSLSTASTSKPTESLTKVNERTKEEDTQPTLGVLEEDDEFEEFAVAGQRGIDAGVLYINPGRDYRLG
jgi:hypothetical protein